MSKRESISSMDERSAYAALKELQDSFRWLSEGFSSDEYTFPIIPKFFAELSVVLLDGDPFDEIESPARRVEIRNRLNKFIINNGGLLDKLVRYYDFFYELRTKTDVKSAGYAFLYLADYVERCEILSGRDVANFISVAISLAEFASIQKFEEYYETSDVHQLYVELRKKIQAVSDGASSSAVDVQQKMTELSNAYGDLERKSGEIHADFDGAKNLLRDSIEAEKNLLVRDLKNLREEQAKELEFAKKAYETGKALEEPVTYWNTKRKKHAWWALGLGVVTVIVMWFVASYLNSEVNAAIDAVKQSAAKTPEVQTVVAKTSTSLPTVKVVASSAMSASQPVAQVSTDGSKQETWHLDVAALLLKATLCFWVLRVMVRIFLSHVHLENDAAERVTMANTYLSLLRSGKMQDKDDLKTVLAALFRPTGDGIVKDEGMPLSITEIVTRQGAAK